MNELYTFLFGDGSVIMAEPFSLGALAANIALTSLFSALSSKFAPAPPKPKRVPGFKANRPFEPLVQPKPSFLQTAFGTAAQFTPLVMQQIMSKQAGDLEFQRSQQAANLQNVIGLDPSLALAQGTTGQERFDDVARLENISGVGISRAPKSPEALQRFNQALEGAGIPGARQESVEIDKARFKAIQDVRSRIGQERKLDVASKRESLKLTRAQIKETEANAKRLLGDIDLTAGKKAKINSRLERIKGLNRQYLKLLDLGDEKGAEITLNKIGVLQSEIDGIAESAGKPKATPKPKKETTEDAIQIYKELKISSDSITPEDLRLLKGRIPGFNSKKFLEALKEVSPESPTPKPPDVVSSVPQPEQESFFSKSPLARGGKFTIEQLLNLIQSGRKLGIGGGF